MNKENFFYQCNKDIHEKDITTEFVFFLQDMHPIKKS
jgi:hypothetical protein